MTFQSSKCNRCGNLTCLVLGGVTPEVRGQAQGLIVLITYGVGMLIGAQLAGQLYNSFLGSANALTLDQWHDFWWVPAIFAGVVMIIFMIFFDDKVIEDKEDVEASDFKV